MICAGCGQPATGWVDRDADESIAERHVPVCFRCATQKAFCEVCGALRRLIDLDATVEGWTCMTLPCWSVMEARVADGYDRLVHEQESDYRGMV